MSRAALSALGRLMSLATLRLQTNIDGIIVHFLQMDHTYASLPRRSPLTLLRSVTGRQYGATKGRRNGAI
ncbi:MAG: hypothetical protein ACYCQL_04235 [Acidithiobacillus sp.]